MSEGAGFRLRFLGVVLLPAAALMALEIVSSRLLAPAFGNSVYVWGSIIGVFLAAMSAGYVAGGRLADARPRLATLGAVLLASAALQALTAAVGRVAVERIGAASGGRPIGTLLAVGLLFGPATAALATVSPFAVRLAGREPDRLGGVAGRLFALSTFGSLGGTLAATFWLIPELDLDAILALLVSVTAFSALLCADRALPVVAAVAIAAVAWLSPTLGRRAETTRAERITPYQTLVVEEANGLRTLISDGVRHGSIRVDTGEPALTYLHGAAIALLARPETTRMLGLGLGTGGAGKLLRSLAGELEVRYVEIDPAVPELAREWFALDPSIAVEVDDARRFLAGNEERWDLIYCDTYVGQSVPFHLATREFFELVRSRLTPGGLVEVNLAGHVEHPFARAIVRTMGAVFPAVQVFDVPDSGNFLLVAGDGPLPPPSELERRAVGLDRRRGTAPRYRRVAMSRWSGAVDLSDVPILTDGYAPVDALLDLGATAARLPEVAPVR
jgi:spermidine synthase